MERYWYTYPNEKYGYNSYYTVVKNLVFKIQLHPKIKKKFIPLYPNLLPAEKIEEKNIDKINNRLFALAWLKKNPHYKLVQDNFLLLGYKSLEEVCSENNALPIIRKASAKEQRYLIILETTAKKILHDFLPFEAFPPYKIIENKNSSASGFAETIKLKKSLKTDYGFRFRHKLVSICLRQDIFQRSSFNIALSTFIHELCHCFGGDKSDSFSYALTVAMNKVIDCCDIVIESRELWSNI